MPTGRRVALSSEKLKYIFVFFSRIIVELRLPELLTSRALFEFMISLVSF